MPPGAEWTHALVLSELFDLSKPDVYTVEVLRLNFEGTNDPPTTSNVITVTVTNLSVMRTRRALATSRRKNVKPIPLFA